MVSMDFNLIDPGICTFPVWTPVEADDSRVQVCFPDYIWAAACIVFPGFPVTGVFYSLPDMPGKDSNGSQLDIKAGIGLVQGADNLIPGYIDLSDDFTQPFTEGQMNAFVKQCKFEYLLHAI